MRLCGVTCEQFSYLNLHACHPRLVVHPISSITYTNTMHSGNFVAFASDDYGNFPE